MPTPPNNANPTPAPGNEPIDEEPTLEDAAHNVITAYDKLSRYDGVPPDLRHLAAPLRGH